MSDLRITDLMVSLRDIPERGPADVLIEMSHAQRDLIGDAARLIGLNKAKFCRAVCISAAERVMKEMGVKL